MRSTFMGLETNKRGLFTQQSALYTTGHNISNANSPGYSRQRVNMQASQGFPGTGLNTGTMPGFLGTGVEAGSIQRIRDTFVDHQFRQEANKLGYWESRSQAISQMEDVLNEPSEYGLSKSLSEFWQSLQDLAVNPENGGARAVVVQRGIAVVDSFNYIHTSLTEVQTNLGKEIGVVTSEVNAILEQIAGLNDQIAQVEPNGYLPNDLYDARDSLLDQLATFFPIETEKVDSGGRALNIAEGSLTVRIKTSTGAIDVVNGNDFAKMSVNGADNQGNPTGPITAFTFTASGKAAGGPIGVESMHNIGKMKSLVDSYGYEESGVTKGLYPEMLAQIDDMAKAFAEEFNEIHAKGYPLEGNGAPNWFFIREDTTKPFSTSNLKVNDAIIKDPSLIRASSGIEEEGNGNQAKELANMQFNGLEGLGGSTVQTYFQGIIGQLGVDGQQAERMTFNTATLLGAVEHRRASISSVSLDEEMTDMIKYQQAYNASARMITVVDETLDKIINGMGLAGR
ncbi:flagellar hook-associated protein FlgK [Sporosarcina sp. HYO08]|uniref:flagellar hook-associated protein FlgK n=1 Tax=Sporosarcina sp. HYO08 TaxID=1759557 RepID=UPI000797C656|nr:flagellar hook-associated protein FlgK [Sporosarcina sp. HYO08]KXH84137.1 flagellar biosynthesis protein FlgK [Sporosarcina sp. HYO08]